MTLIIAITILYKKYTYAKVKLEYEMHDMRNIAGLGVSSDKYE